MASVASRALRPLLLIATLLVLLVPASPATAGPTPCWKLVVNDWQDDGRIDQIYDDVCYDEALERLPADLREYSSLADDIEIARGLASRKLLPPIRKGGPPVKPGSFPSREATAPAAADDDDGWASGTLGKFAPSAADEVPIPLLILGGIATLLMASGAAGMVARRTHHRRLPGQF